MIPLNRKQFPSSKVDLAEALEQAAHRFIPKDGQLVELHSRVFPYIDGIAFNFDGARFENAPPPFPKPNGDTSAAFEAGTLTLSAREIAIRDLPLNFSLEAHGLDLHRGREENGDAVLVIHRVRDGHLSISFTQTDVERAMEKVVRQQGRGLTIDRVRLAMRARGPRSIAVDVRCEARKLLFRAQIDVSGQIDINEDFVVRASNLKCKSTGGIGSIACTALEPVFRDLEKKRFALSSLPLGNIRVRDVRVAVGDTVEITANFGSPA